MKAEDTHEVEVVLHLRVPKALPERHIERMRMALVTVAADMDHVIEAGVDTPTPAEDPSPVSHDPCITGTVEIDGQRSEFLLPLDNDSVRYSQWGADNTVLWPRTDLLEALADAAREWAYDNLRGEEDPDE